ncbi:hypothetical protein SAMN05216601_102316 [Ectopseudomonas composti]|uniref:LA2681-like HEPN domain-containing protein n=1 Tax=Ectopseudomonas composti TaxID=658457 RepID=A0A1I5KA50_9GAMM|nr:LA2681 family HEPN domain-containing protein [Pseudomonas composti]SFO81858.1 hypothetical protein SAMN05216601_102316 [Pseudomonas composti]
MENNLDLLSSLALDIDSAIDNERADLLITLSDQINCLINDKKTGSDNFKSTLTFYLSNIYQFLGARKGDAWDNPDYANAIICHRKFYRYNEHAENILHKVQVNHANSLEYLCRIFEAIPLWKKGIVNPGEPQEVALYRLASGLLNLSSYLYDDSHTYYYQLYSYNYLKKLKSKGFFYHSGIQSSFTPESDSLISKFIEHAQDSFDSDPDLLGHDYMPRHAKEEMRYRAWCKDNVLFLNPLNDLDSAWVVDHDVLGFPPYSTPVSEGPYLSASFSSMKNEYCFHRHVFYEGITKQYRRFIDKDKYLTDTLDGVLYNGHIEKIKSALRGCFSILDKISKLLDKYYNLNSKDVAFNRQWFSRQAILKDQANPFLTALYWLSKDFSPHDGKEQRPSYWLEDEAFEVRELRNELEHGWVRVVTEKNHHSLFWGNAHDYAYKVTSLELIDKGMYVLKQTRNALIYMCLAINHTEKNKPDKDDGITLSNRVPII